MKTVFLFLFTLATLGTALADEHATIETKEVTYSGGGVEMKGFLAWDKSKEGKRPGVLVVHEWWGHNDYARKRAKMLAELGYVALAVDMYGDGKTADHPKDAGAFMQAALADIDAAEERFAAAMKVLNEHEAADPEKTAAIGYCFGGGVVLHAARVGMDLDAVVSFHGSLGAQKPAEKGKVKAKVLVLNGAADQMVSEDSITAFKEEMDAAEVNYEFVNYPDALHGFTNPGATELGEKFGIPIGYQKEADEKSWAAMKAFFEKLF